MSPIEPPPAGRHSPSRPAAGDREGMLDLPLGGGDEESGGPPLPHGPRGSAHRRGPRRRALTLVAVALLVAVGVVAGYLLPRRSPAVIRPSQPLVDFGDQRVGVASDPRELRLEDGGERTLEMSAIGIVGEAAGDYSLVTDGCSGARLAAGAPCVLRLRFAPAAPGARRATLRLTGTAANSPLGVPLAGNGVAPELNAEPSTLDFGEQPLGATTAPGLLTLRNAGSAPLAIKAILVEGEAAHEFGAVADRCSGALLAPGAACALKFTFTPGALGERRARLRVWSDAAGEPAAIDFVGAGAALRAAVSPVRLDLGPGRVGGAGDTGTVTLDNRGDAPLAVAAAAVAGTDAAAFVAVHDACSGKTLPAGAHCTVGVSFRPARAGDQTATLTFHLGGTPEAPRVDLAGRGVQPGLEVAGLAGDALDFGAVALGAAADRRLELSNPSTVAVHVRRLTLGGTAGGDFRVAGDGCSGELAAGGRCAVSLRFAPAALGARTGELAVESDAPGSPLRVPLAGAGLPAPVPVIRLSTAALRFGEVAVGGRSEIVSLTLSNTGDARLVLSSVTLGGAYGADFRIVPGSCAVPGFLAPGGDCTLGLRFIPTAPGPRAARLLVRHDAAGGTASVELSGRGGAP
jgi:HYDIN/CFA65/VesB-like, Ig-like domain